MDQTRRAGALTGVRVLGASGDFSAPRRIAWADGRFAAESAGANTRGDSVAGDLADPAASDLADPKAGEFDASGLWLIPGLVDAHVHAAWHAFDAADRSALDNAATAAATASGLARTLAAGITRVRDAGGLTAAALAEVPAAARPSVQLSVRMLDRAAADAAGGLDRAVEAVLAEGARWVKLVATAGVAAPAGAGLEPVFTAAETRDAVRRAERAGAGTMVHAWGGQAIDDAITAGATSIEHGIFLTAEQAAAAADAGLTFVPTLRIYTLVQRMIAAGALPAAFRGRVEEAVAAHPAAVLRARDAGLPIALGTDSGTPDQHGTVRLEFDALVAAGLSPSEALHAATRGGAELLGRVETAHVAGRGAPGTLDVGAPAEAVLLRRDPREPGALSDPAAIVRVLAGGALLDPGLLDPVPHNAAPECERSPRKDPK